MKTNLVSCLLFATASVTGVARAQTVQAATPAPVATGVIAPALPTPNQYVYAARVPGVSELATFAAAQGLVIERIVQTPT